MKKPNIFGNDFAFQINYKLKMRLTTIFFMIVALFQIFASDTYAQKTKITIRLDEVAVEDVLNEIEKRTDFKFFYNDKDLDYQKIVSVNVNKTRVSEILDGLFQSSRITYELFNKQIILKIDKSSPPPLQKLSLQRTISGSIVDADGQPLPGANVLEKGTINGTVTDFDGNFSITLSSETPVLVFSYLGYKTKEITVEGQTSLPVVLEQDAQGLDEIVVVGYGSVRKSELIGSVGSVKGEDLNTDSQASVSQIIQGRVAGVQVTRTTGMPGDGFSIRVRGTNSITAGNEPLYVIDGLPGANPGSTLNPSDIQSIEVLKDASATAIYGARGSNGVVLITTKQGRKDTGLQINYNLTAGIQTVAKKLDVMNAQEYMQFINDVSADRGQAQPFTAEDFVTIGNGTDWQDAVLRPAFVQEHRLSFSGGSSDTQYYLSLNYFDQEGIVIDSGFERLGGRVNITHNIGEKMKVGFNLNNSVLTQDLVPNTVGDNSNAGVISTALQMPPTMSIFDEDGEYSFSSQDMSNPVAQAKTIDQFNYTTRIYGNAFAEYEIIQGLKSKINLGFDQAKTEFEEVLNDKTQRGVLNEGRATRSLTDNSSVLFEFTTEYVKTFMDKHKFTLLGGYSYQKFENSYFSSAAQGFPSTSFGSNNLGSGDSTQNMVESSKQENTLISGFGRLNYNFDDRYLFTGSFRADGSSRFGENNKVAYFPSGALAWNVSNEAFFPDEALVSNLKLRASYGLSGNQEIDNGRSLVLLGSGDIAVFDGIEYESIAAVQLANPNLKWETTKSLNAGIDFGILNGRISGSVEYFQNKTEDLLLELPIPSTTGFLSSLQNVGDTKNTGFELNLSSNNLTGGFKWVTDLNVSTLKNEVVSLGELDRILQGGIRFITNFTLLEPGKPINSYYGYVFDGVFQTQEEVDNAPTQTNKTVGGRKFRDINGDGAIDEEDRTVLGDPFPDFTLGINNTFSYKGFTLDVFLQGKFGFELANITNIDSENPLDNLRNRQRYVLNRWTPDNPTNETPSFVSPVQTYDFNSRIVEDASFLRIQNARFGYSFPNLNINGISALFVYLSGQNIATFTNYRGYNPDANTFGSSNVRIDYNAYPLATTYSLGINVKF